MNDASTALVCRELRLRCFRNFTELELQFPNSGAVIVGDNGSGKTNLLEAVHYLEIFRSFRGAADEQLVRFDGEAFFVRGRFEDLAAGRVTELTAAYEPRTRRKRVTLDGVVIERLSDAIGRLGTVIFSPSDIAVIAGAPGERRRFLDIVLSLNTRGYLDALQRYRQVLRQRNALLRNGTSGTALGVWDDALTESGVRVMLARAEWVQLHRARFAELYAAISGGTACALRYAPDVSLAEATSPEQIRTAFAQRLRRVSVRERERRVTLAGPHRDELELRLDTGGGAVDLRQFGSGGQVRTAAIALRMIEAETVREGRGFRPLLLLDDVFAELDAPRSRRILELFRQGGHGQVLLTAPKPADVLLDEQDAAFAQPIARWTIAAGAVTT